MAAFSLRAARTQARRRDRAASGEELAEIDLDDAAARHRDADDAPVERQGIEIAGDVVAADDVEHDVHAASRRKAA